MNKNVVVWKNIILSFLIAFLIGCNKPAQRLKEGDIKDNYYNTGHQRRKALMNQYQLHIRKGVRIFGDNKNIDSAKVKIINLTSGKTRTELYIDVEIYLDDDLLVKEDVLKTESGFAPFKITKGKHTLHVSSKKGVSILIKELDISKSLWIDINYDYYVSDGHPDAHKQGFHFLVRDYPTYHK